MAGLSIVIMTVVGCLCAVTCKPVDNFDSADVQPIKMQPPRLWKRFINPSLTYGDFGDDSLIKMRTKRGADECEKLELCRLHAQSSHSFFAAYELYFVNKENAKLWDHNAHTMADCERRFSGCSGSGESRPAPAHAQASSPSAARRTYYVQYDDDDDDY